MIYTCHHCTHLAADHTPDGCVHSVGDRYCWCAYSAAEVQAGDTDINPPEEEAFGFRPVDELPLSWLTRNRERTASTVSRPRRISAAHTTPEPTR